MYRWHRLGTNARKAILMLLTAALVLALFAVTGNKDVWLFGIVGLFFWAIHTP